MKIIKEGNYVFSGICSNCKCSVEWTPAEVQTYKTSENETKSVDTMDCPWCKRKMRITIINQ